MFCSNCGQAIPENSNFCQHCGATVQHILPPKDMLTTQEEKIQETTTQEQNTQETSIQESENTTEEATGLSDFLDNQYTDTSQKKNNELHNIGFAIIGVLAVALLIVFLIGLMTNHNSNSFDTTANTTTTTDSSSNDSTSNQPINNKIYSIGMTPEEFKESWNNIVEKENLNELTIDNLKISKGEVQDGCVCFFNKNHSLVGTINKKDNSLRSIMIMSNTTDKYSTTNVIISWGNLVEVTNPDLSANDRHALFDKLGLFQENLDSDSLDKSTVWGKIKYSLSCSKEVGFIFSASNSEDN